MSEMVLTKQWFEYFANRILTEFDMDVTQIDDYQRDVAPLVYTALHNRRVLNKPRKVIPSIFFMQGEWAKNERWLKLKATIESGGDINLYMSKSLKNWRSIDYLLYNYNISHFHLYKNKDGGIRHELVFGVFTDGEFYVLCVGDHNDIYKPDQLISLANESWKKNIFEYRDELDSYSEFCSKTFKKQANSVKHRFNRIGNIPIKNENGEVIAVVDNSNHTCLINFTLNDICYPEVPIKSYCAYVNEIDHIEKIEMSLVNSVNADQMRLEIIPESKEYLVHVDKKVGFTKRVPFKKRCILCSSFIPVNQA